jgi:hypothetical protein
MSTTRTHAALAPSKVSVLDRDGRGVTLEKVGVEVEVAVYGRNVLALDLATPAGIAAARVLRDALDAALARIRAWEHRFQDWDACAARGREIQRLLASGTTARRAA